jgi:hypothetical protein
MSRAESHNRSNPSRSAPARIHPRDVRLDFVRGFALICIYIDHVPGNALAAMTLRAFGICDASEVFVLVSGIATAMAYSGLFQRDRGQALLRMLHRIARLYLAHILLAIATVSALLWAAAWFENPAYFAHSTLALLPSSPAVAFTGILTLTVQPGYLHVLPVYIVLMMWLPVVLLLAQRHLLLPLLPSCALWLMAGPGLNLPAFGEPTGWYFNPLAWQFLFTIGIVLAHWRETGRAQNDPNSYSRPLLIAASVYLVFCLLIAAPWSILPPFAGWRLVEPNWLSLEAKQNLSYLRLINILALAYVARICIPKAGIWMENLVARAITTIGRNALLVFCVATILDEWLLIVRTQGARGVGYQLAINIGGVLLMWYSAHLAERYYASRPRKAVSPTGMTQQPCGLV